MGAAWLNGRFVDEASASVSIRDAGLLHAAGVFTTMRGYGGAVFRLSDHLRRLRQSCEALFIPLTPKDDDIAAAAGELLERNGLRDARLRLTVTRGEITVNPLHGSRLEPTVLLTAGPIEPYPREYYERGLTAILFDEQKLNPYDLQAGHKTLNYLSRLSALREAVRRGAGEALWFDVHNYLQSASVANIFLIKDGQLTTPPTPAELRDDAALARTIPYPKSAVLPGVTRGVIIDLAARLSIPFTRAPADVNTVLSADEIFLTNSIMGVMPLCRLERHAVGSDRPGPLTHRLAGAYANEVEAGGH